MNACLAVFNCCKSAPPKTGKLGIFCVGPGGSGWDACARACSWVNDTDCVAKALPTCLPHVVGLIIQHLALGGRFLNRPFQRFRLLLRPRLCISRKAAQARRMSTSRVQLDRLLDPENTSVTLGTISRAAKALGRKVGLEMVKAWQAGKFRGAF
jgi:hypothetical protein